jgi:hypothetical protein
MVPGTNLYRPGLWVLLVYVMSLDEAVTVSDRRAEEELHYAKFTREPAPVAAVIDGSLHRASSLRLASESASGAAHRGRDDKG